MIRIKIGEEVRDIDDADEHWVNQQINRHRADGKTVCVRVTVMESDINMEMTTPNCEASGPGGRRPSHQEKEIFDLWDNRGLNDVNFTGGNLVAFLKQLKRIL